DEAIAPLEETMFRRPDMNGVVQQLAQCYFKTGKIAESIDLYARVVDHDPGSFTVRLAYGEALMADRRFDSATVQLKEAIRLQPLKADAYLALTSALQELKRSDEALALSRELTRLVPNDPMGWYNVGLLSLAAKQPDSSIRAFKRAIALRANYAEAYFNIAFVYEERGFDEDAVSSLKRCATISPLLAPDAYNSLAIMYRKSGRFEEAISAHAQAISLRDSSGVLHVSRLNTYYDAQRCTAAKELLETELSRFPDRPDVLYAAARCLLRNGDLERANAIANKLDVLDPVLAEQLRHLMKI
ncbi:MAG: tetratricopeptide repeat protein, partial [Candidatus Kapabacteria bacterium]|nr:tetratricopeptide repeat protein [Candidatus Kapabacteria bacterium]